MARPPHRPRSHPRRPLGLASLQVSRGRRANPARLLAGVRHDHGDAVAQGKAIAGWEGATSSEVVAYRFYDNPFYTGTYAVYYFSAQTQTTTTKSAGAGQEYIYWYEWGLPYEFWDDGPEWSGWSERAGGAS